MKLLTININDIDNAYQIVRTSIAVEGFKTLVMGFMVLTFIVRLYNVYKETQSNEDGVPTMKDFQKMAWELAFLCVAMALFPTLLATLENIFAEVMTKMQEKMGTERYDMTDLFLEPIKADWDKITSNGYMNVLVNPIGTGIDYLLAYLVGPLVSVFYLYSSTLFIAGRYMLLLMLELISPVAIACFYNENTRQYFYQWTRNLLICYLMVPCFILASQFSDEIVRQFIMTTSWMVTIQILFSLVLKLSLLGIVRSKISNLF